MKYNSRLSSYLSRISGRFCLGGALSVTLASMVVAAPGSNSLLTRLEKNEVIATKVGSSFVVQALVSKDFAKVAGAFSDFKKLPEIFKEVGYARPFVSKDNRQFLYLKLRGLTDGLGVLMEAREADAGAFVNARELVISADGFKKRELDPNSALTKDPSQVELQTQMEAAAKAGEGTRTIGALRGITLEGPMDPIMQLPTVRFTINLGIAPYDYVPGPANLGAKAEHKTYMAIKVSVGTQVAKEYIGDYRGFGEQRMTTATFVGQTVLESLRAQLERL